MTTINRLDISLTEEGWNQGEGLPRLRVSIEPLSTEDDIRSITYCYTDRDGPHDGSLDLDLIESIETQFYIDPEKMIWDFQDCRRSSLINKLEVIMAELTAAEIQNMASAYTIIFNLEVTRCIPNYRQRLVDTFLAQVSVYLVVLELVYNNLIWSAFPFCFHPPFDRLDGRSLTYYAIEYLTIPLEAMKAISSSSFSQELGWLICSFRNTWSNDYLLGDKIDTSQILYQVTNKIVMITTRDITKIQGQIQDTVDSYYRKTSEHLEALNQRLNRLEEQINRSPMHTQQELTSKIHEPRTESVPNIPEPRTESVPNIPEPIRTDKSVELPAISDHSQRIPRLIRHHNGKPV